MKTFLAILTVAALTGCANIHNRQTDFSYDADGKVIRKIENDAHSYTLWATKSNMSKYSSTQTDKTQKLTVGELGQSAETINTNTVSALTAIVELLKELKK